MANSITSDITISTAITVLEELLAPLGAFTANITNEIQPRRQDSVNVPIVKKGSSARDYAYGTGYNTSADTDVSVVNVPLVERIKPFHLADVDMNKSPLTIASYAKANAHEFGRYILQTVFDMIDTDLASNSPTVTNVASVNASDVALTNIQNIQDDLDQNGAPFDRHVVMNASVNSALMPSSIETFGPNVLQGGRFGNLYGMSTHVSTVTAGGIDEVHTLGCSSDAIIIANRMPDVSGQATLEEYTPFTIDGLGLQCAYRRYFEPSKGESFGAFTTIFGAAIAKPTHMSVITRAS
jgi:hypothetical protein